MSPLNLQIVLSHYLWVYLLIGLCFGFVLELSGFGDSRKLAAQFYFFDMRVFKVMFSAIITAMILIFFTSSVGLTDFSKLYVNPTFLWSGIVGGLVMGVGFILGGFCPGTSLVGAATLKIDALLFVLGVLFGVYLFGESQPYIDSFFNSGSLGRLTLSDVLQIDAGRIVFVILTLALLAFWGAEWTEKKLNLLHEKTKPLEKKIIKFSIFFAFVFVLISILKGQPEFEKRWTWIDPRVSESFAQGDFNIHPLELRDLMINPNISLEILDLRDEEAFNNFHLENASRRTEKEILSFRFLQRLTNEPPNHVVVLFDTNQDHLKTVFKKLKGADVMNLYILDGGLENWLKVFPVDPLYSSASESFPQALGSSQFSSFPYDPIHLEKNLNLNYVKKVKLQTKSLTKGGCG